MTNNVPAERILGKIYLIRGTKVMLDSDLAELYGVETRVLKQAVRRNISRFPDDFMFELTKKEYQSLRSQNVILKRGQHSKYPPFAFSEQGVAIIPKNPMTFQLVAPGPASQPPSFRAFKPNSFSSYPLCPITHYL
jgi:hypothetical protein